MKFKLCEQVKCIWEDHRTIDNWHDTDEIVNLKPAVVETLGYFMGENKDCIFISSSLFRVDNSVFNSQLIIKSCIKSIKKVR